jgi:hypothetical protein
MAKTNLFDGKYEEIAMSNLATSTVEFVEKILFRSVLAGCSMAYTYSYYDTLPRQHPDVCALC